MWLLSSRPGASVDIVTGVVGGDFWKRFKVVDELRHDAVYGADTASAEDNSFHDRGAPRGWGRWLRRR